MTSFVSRHVIWNVVLSLKEADKIFKNFMPKDEDSKIVRIYSILLTFFVALSVPLSAFVYYSDRSVLKICIFQYSGVYYMLTVISTVVFVNAIIVRLSLMTKVLVSIVHTDTNKISALSFFDKNGHKMEIISAMAEVYAKLIDASEGVSTVNGPPMMLASGNLFFYTIFTAFMTYKDVSQSNVDNTTAATALFTIYLQVLTFSVISTTTLARFETQRILKVCNELFKHSQDQMLTAMLILISYGRTLPPARGRSG